MAVQLRLTTFVTNAGIPVTGLAGANIPEIEIWNAGTGAVVQSSTDTTEVAGGFYRFDFTPTAGVDYVALFDHDPAAISQVTPQERYNTSSFSEFIDDIVPEGGSEDYGTKFQRLDAAVTTRAAPGDAMDLVTDAVDATSVATDAIDADALATSAVDEIVDQVWDELRSAHTDSGSFGEFTGDATMRGTDGANTVVPLAAATDQAEHDATQSDIAALNDLSQAQILSDATPFAGANINATISSRATQASLDVVDQNVDDLEQATIAAQLTAASGSTTTEVRTGATQANGFYDELVLVIVNSAGVVARRILTYLNTNGAFTVNTLPFTPAISDPVIIVARTALSSLDTTGIADAVWDELRAGHTDSGSFGEFTGDAAMRGTDGANTTVPLAAATDQAEHDATQADIAALNDLSQAQILSDATPFAGANINATISSRAQPGDAMDLVANAVDAAAIATDAIDADAIAANAIGASELATDAIGADQLATTGINEIRDSILDDATRFSGGDIDVAISTRNAVTPLAAATDQAEHDATQADIAALNDLSQAQILSDATPFAGANINATISSRATQASLDVVDQNVDDLEEAMIAAQLAATSGSTTTEVRTGATQATGFYDDMVLVVVNSAGVVARQIAAYSNTNGAFTVTTLPFTPAVSDPVVVVARTAVSSVDLPGIADAVWDELRSGHTDSGSFGEFTGDATMRGTDGANTTVPLAAATDQAEHDQTQTDIAALNDPTAAVVADAVWDELRAGHTTSLSFGEFTGDATMRGTDGANTTVPLAAAADQAEHDATQADIAALNDLDAAAVEDAVWDAAIASHVAAGSFGEEVQAHAQPGDAMDLVANAVDAAAVATDAIDADALATDAVNEIRDSILSDSTPFAGANINATISSRATQTSLDVVDANVDDLEEATIAAQLAATSGSTTTEIRTGATQATGFYDDMVIVVVNSAGVATRPILSYANTNGAFTVDTLPFTPAVSDPVIVLARTSSATATVDNAAIADAVWDELRAGHTDSGSFGEFTGDATMRGTDGANTTVPLAAATDQAEHDQTQTDIAALNDLDAAGVEDAVWDAARASHTDVGSFGQFTGDATMRGTDGANTTVPLAAAADQAEHDATQSDIAALNDLDAVGVEDAVWDAARASHTDAGSFGLDTGDAPMRGTDGANTTVPLAAATDQAEHDQTQTDIAALNDPTAAVVADAVWDELRAAHTTSASYGEFTGDAAMRGTDGANTVVPLAAATDQGEHDQTQTDIGALNDLSQADVQTALTAQGYTVARAALLDNLDAAISGVAAAVWALTTTGNQLAGSFGKALTRLFGADTRTKLFFAVSAISTVGREVPTNAVSHMEVQVRDDGGAYPGGSYFVVFGYNVGDSATDPPRSSNTEAAAPTDGTFTSTEFPT